MTSAKRVVVLANALVGLSVLHLVAAHAMSVVHARFATVDEGYASALAERLLEGYRLYDGAVSQRGPLMYYVYEGIAASFGWDNVIALRLVALAFAMVLVLVVYWGGNVVASRVCGAIAASLTAYGLTYGVGPWDGLGLNGETMLLPFLVAGAIVPLVALRHGPGSTPRSTRLVLAGLALGAAACIKQVAAGHAIVVMMLLVGDALRGRALWSKRHALDVSIFCGSFAFIPLAFAVHAYAAGTLHQLVYYCITYNLTIHTRVHEASPHWVGLMEWACEHSIFFSGLVLLGVLRVIAWRSRLAEAGKGAYGIAPILRADRVDYIVLHAGVALMFAACVPQRFGHYYLTVVPFLGIALSARLPETTRPLGIAVGLAAAWLLPAIGMAYKRGHDEGRVAHDRSVERVAHEVEAETSREDRVFVWGFSPWIYGYAHRRPAGRYVFATYVTGFVPWFWEALDSEPTRVVPGSMEALIADLDREKPAMVIDAGSVRIGRSIRAYEATSAWLHVNYCFAWRIGAFDAYRRKGGDGTCKNPCFPYQAAPVDYSDAPLGIPTPATVDQETSCALPPGGFLEPITFSATSRRD